MKINDELFQEIKTEEERLSGLTLKQLENEAGHKAPHRALAKEGMIQEVLSKRYGDDVFTAYLERDSQ